MASPGSALKPWLRGTMEPEHHGTLEPWHHGTYPRRMDLISGFRYRHPYTRFRHTVEERCAALRQLAPEELLCLAATPTETLRFEWRTGTISLIIWQHQPDTVRVVVQGFLRFPSWSPAAAVALDGFDKSADGELRRIPDDELADFG